MVNANTNGRRLLETPNAEELKQAEIQEYNGLVQQLKPKPPLLKIVFGLS